MQQLRLDAIAIGSQYASARMTRQSDRCGFRGWTVLVRSLLGLGFSLSFVKVTKFVCWLLLRNVMGRPTVQHCSPLTRSPVDNAQVTAGLMCKLDELVTSRDVLAVLMIGCLHGNHSNLESIAVGDVDVSHPKGTLGLFIVLWVVLQKQTIATLELFQQLPRRVNVDMKEQSFHHRPSSSDVNHVHAVEQVVCNCQHTAIPNPKRGLSQCHAHNIHWVIALQLNPIANVKAMATKQKDKTVEDVTGRVSKDEGQGKQCGAHRHGYIREAATRKHNLQKKECHDGYSSIKKGPHGFDNRVKVSQTQGKVLAIVINLDHNFTHIVLAQALCTMRIKGSSANL
eukprot:m.256219 g.256219  ORF g.256219 m.256219 type:complete len:340 (+) comp17561_c0_seq10:231-1250(+)